MSDRTAKAEALRIYDIVRRDYVGSDADPIDLEAVFFMGMAQFEMQQAIHEGLDALIGLLRDLLPTRQPVQYRGTEPVEADRD